MLKKEAEGLFNNLRQIAGMGYNPYQGMDVAAFTPQQRAGFEAADAAATAFGMPAGGAPTMPTPTVGEAGIPGYSTFDIMKAETPNFESLMSQVQGLFKSFSEKPKSKPSGRSMLDNEHLFRRAEGPGGFGSNGYSSGGGVGR